MSKFLSHISLKSLLKESTTTDLTKQRSKSRLNDFPTGFALIRDPALNKGTAFTEEERQRLGLQGMLPPRIHSLDEQVERVLWNLRKKTSNIDRYIFLSNLQDRNKTLFYGSSSITLKN